MNITKFETNFKRNLFMHETKDITFNDDSNNEENKIINVYPTLEFQEFIGFGRCSNSALLVIIYLLLQKKFLAVF